MFRSGGSRGTNNLQNTADKENDKNRVGTKLGLTLTVTSHVMRSRLLTSLRPGVQCKRPTGMVEKAEISS